MEVETKSPYVVQFNRGHFREIVLGIFPCLLELTACSSDNYYTGLYHPSETLWIVSLSMCLDLPLMLHRSLCHLFMNSEEFSRHHFFFLIGKHIFLYHREKYIHEEERVLSCCFMIPMFC